MRNNRWPLVAGGVTLLLVLAGCLQSAETGSDPDTGDDPGGTTRDRPIVEQGVSVIVDQQAYRTGEDIRVSVRNHNDGAVATYSHQSFCSIIELERRLENDWQRIRDCNSTEPGETVVLSAGTETLVQLPGLVESPDMIGLTEPGTYRARLNYSPGEEFSFGDARVSTSDPFTVER